MATIGAAVFEFLHVPQDGKVIALVIFSASFFVAAVAALILTLNDMRRREDSTKKTPGKVSIWLMVAASVALPLVAAATGPLGELSLAGVVSGSLMVFLGYLAWIGTTASSSTSAASSSREYQL